MGRLLDRNSWQFLWYLKGNAELKGGKMYTAWYDKSDTAWYARLQPKAADNLTIMAGSFFPVVSTHLTCSKKGTIWVHLLETMSPLWSQEMCLLCAGTCFWLALKLQVIRKGSRPYPFLGHLGQDEYSSHLVKQLGSLCWPIICSCFSLLVATQNCIVWVAWWPYQCFK